MAIYKIGFCWSLTKLPVYKPYYHNLEQKTVSVWKTCQSAAFSPWYCKVARSK
uniref:Uncharacterized protein n=1 Tax=Manihot esculenta TaxID=3983 RepID=A0A2C9VLW6_MANES